MQEQQRERQATLRREPQVPGAFTFARQASNLRGQAVSFWRDLEHSDWASLTPQNKLMVQVLRSPLCSSLSFRACAAPVVPRPTFVVGVLDCTAACVNKL